MTEKRSSYPGMSVYEKLLKTCLDSVSGLKKMMTKDKRSLSGRYLDIARLYEKTGNYTNALEWCRKSVGLAEKADLGRRALADRCYTLAGIYMKLGDDSAAEQNYRTAIGNCCPADAQVQIRCLRRLSAIYESRNDDDNYTDCLEKITEVEENRFCREKTRENFISLQKSCIKLGDALAVKGRREEAGRVCSDASFRMTEYMPSNTSVMEAAQNAGIYIGIGDVQMKISDPMSGDSIFSSYSEACDELYKWYKELPDELIVLLFNTCVKALSSKPVITLVQIVSRYADTAHRILAEHGDLFDNITDEYHRLFELSKENGDRYSRQGQHRRAIEYYEKAAETAKRSQECCPCAAAERDIAQICSTLADSYMAMNDTDNAIRFYTEAQTIRLRLAEDSEEFADLCGLADSYAGLGKYCESSGHYDEAVENYNRSYELYKRVIDRDGDNYNSALYKSGLCLFHIGEIYVRNNEPDRSIGIFSDSYRIMKNSVLFFKSEARYFDLAGLCHTMSGVYKGLGDFDKSLKYGDDAVTYYRLALGERRADIYKTRLRECLEQLAATAKESGDILKYAGYAEALADMEHENSFYNKTFDELSYAAGRYLEIGRLYKKNGSRSSAEGCFVKALDNAEYALVTDRAEEIMPCCREICRELCACLRLPYSGKTELYELLADIAQHMAEESDDNERLHTIIVKENKVGSVCAQRGYISEARLIFRTTIFACSKFMKLYPGHWCSKYLADALSGYAKVTEDDEERLTCAQKAFDIYDDIMRSDEISWAHYEAVRNAAKNYLDSLKNKDSAD